MSTPRTRVWIKFCSLHHLSRMSSDWNSNLRCSTNWCRYHMSKAESWKSNRAEGTWAGTMQWNTGISSVFQVSLGRLLYGCWDEDCCSSSSLGYIGGSFREPLILWGVAPGSNVPVLWVEILLSAKCNNAPGSEPTRIFSDALTSLPDTTCKTYEAPMKGR